MASRLNRTAVLPAASMYALWTAGTWFFEGRIETLLRPDAVADRLVYALAVNLCLGVAGTVLLVRSLGRRPDATGPERSGFGSWRRSLTCAVAGFGLGLASYIGQEALSTDPVVVANAFSQVFVVSVAKVMVCWVLVGAAVEAALEPRTGRAGTVLAALVSAVLFGAYHFAHSAPFNTWSMVTLLTAVGLATGTFFFLSRDVLGTAIFHNFLGTFGVTQALADTGGSRALETLQVPLVATALTTTVLVLAGYWWVRRGRSTRSDHETARRRRTVSQP